MTEKNDPIADSLGIEPIPARTGEIVQAPNNVPQADIDPEGEQDFQYARQNMYNVIEKGVDALEEMLEIAKSSEHPRAFEVVATIMNTLQNANKDLVKIGQERREEAVSGKEERNASKDVTNNNLFVGSTEDLRKMLESMKKDD